jgi:hypothetical protein
VGKRSMSERIVRVRGAGVLALAVLILGLAASAARPTGPIDVPTSTEPRVAVAKSESGPGFLTSQGASRPFERIKPDTTLYSRDLLLALPGFQADLAPSNGAVKLRLYGNLPEMSDSNVLESAVILHDTSHFDLDFTLLRGRVVLTNTKKKGEAKVWLRTEITGVQLSLAEPGTEVAVELYGRWMPGMPFSLKRSDENVPVRLWDVYVRKGAVDIKAGRNEWHMSASPGRDYFHGDSVNGPAEGGPQRLKEVPAWADLTSPKSAILKRVKSVIDEYRTTSESKDIAEVPAALLAAAAKDKDKERAMLMRRMLIFALAAMDDVERVAALLGTSSNDEIRKTAVIALRHWIGARPGRDEKMYNVLVDGIGYTKNEAETVMQLLHSPFNPEQPETYETLIAYLKHRRQAVRELAHWHLVRLAPIGRKITYNASADAAERDKAADEWKKLIPSGELPKDPEEKDKKDKDKDKGKGKEEK